MKQLLQILLIFQVSSGYGQSDQNLVYTSFLGGNDFDFATFVDFETSSNLFCVGGNSRSDNMPLIGNSYQPFYAGTEDGYFAKLDQNGNIVYSTYFGGSDSDGISDFEEGANGEYVLSGGTQSADFPLLNESNGEFGGNSMGWLAKFDINHVLLWSTFVGGEGSFESVGSHVISNEGDVFFAGITSSEGLGTPGVYQEEIINTDVFSGLVGKYSSDGTPEWISYVAQEGLVVVTTIDFSPDEASVYVYGVTSGDAAFSGVAYQNESNGSDEAFLLSLSADNGTLNWGTYFGGTSFESPGRMQVTNEGDIIISGATASSTNISSTGAFQENLSGPSDYYLASFNSEGQLNWSTYYGGDGAEDTGSTWVEVSEDYMLVGSLPYSENMPLIGSPYVDDVDINQINLSTGFGYIIKMDFEGNPIWSTYANENYQCGTCSRIAIGDNGRFLCAGSYVDEAASAECEGSLSPDAAQSEYGGGFADMSIFIFEDNFLSVSVAEPEELQIHPNPAQDFVVINAESMEEPFIELTITDVSGRIIDREGRLRLGSIYSTSHLTDGVYLLIGSQGEKMFRQKLVVQ